MVDELALGLQIGRLAGAVEAVGVQFKSMDEKLDDHIDRASAQHEERKIKSAEMCDRVGRIETSVISLERKIKPRKKTTPWDRKYLKVWAWVLGLAAPFLAALGFNAEWIDEFIKATDKM